ncbi:hypothetical protein ASPZODRAFT_134852 [Penicilliopsis zonata CBS 506.65]|uniref:MSP domain-containing protein n=1 Tax=Penicilliopsis zonata CBS 506.65 TaxID=1073090 RepID=A0A1L9SC69_9EURO|nr:hypothetical protein ASPZODRAFT_134852 [Penicilliopsis zonata CBS 506.65]OJJ44742.1 hypothetical protein ASPZODRAFT_134852 [Penicilliopsis zonata CBS 506.65]
MSIQLQPPELGFQRPFNREVCQVLHLGNDGPDPIVFKVKTTAPKHYCVRPNSGRIEVGKHVEVQVLLQAMKDEPPLDAKCKDKFLVQSVAVKGDMEFSNVTSIFEKAAKSSIQERKIRVNFLAPESSPASDQTDQANVSTLVDDEPPAYTSPPANFDTPVAGPGKKTTDTSPVPAPDFSEKSTRDPSTPQLTDHTSTLKPAVAAAATEDLNAKLSDAYAQIAKLKEKLADQGLRQRKAPVGAAETATPSLQQQQQPQSAEAGVPVQIVAGLCLLSFLLAYFFF